LEIQNQLVYLGEAKTFKIKFKVKSLQMGRELPAPAIYG